VSYNNYTPCIKQIKTKLSLTNRATHLCKCNGVHAKFGRSELKDVGINAGKPEKLGSPGTLLSWDGRLADAKIHASQSPHVNHIKFDSSVTEDVRINRKEPQNWGAGSAGALAVGEWLKP